MAARGRCERCGKPVADDPAWQRVHDDKTCTTACWCREICWGDNTHAWERRNAPGTGGRPGLTYKIVNSVTGKLVRPYGYSSLEGVRWHFTERRETQPRWDERMRDFVVVEYEVREVGRRPLSDLIPPPSPSTKPKAEKKAEAEPMPEPSRWAFVEID